MSLFSKALYTNPRLQAHRAKPRTTTSHHAPPGARRRVQGGSETLGQPEIWHGVLQVPLRHSQTQNSS